MGETTHLSPNRQKNSTVTAGLLWGAAWRGSVWLALPGAPLGAAYGVSLLLFMSTQSSGRSLNDLPGICSMGLVIALIGAVLGGALGLVVGFVGGPLLILLAQTVRLPDIGTDEGIRAMGRANAVLSFLGVFVISLLLSGGSLSAGVFLFALVPMLAAAWGGRWAGARIAEWYAEL